MLEFMNNPIIHAYWEADLFGKGIFFSLLIISLCTWTVLHQKLAVQKKFLASGRSLKDFLIKNRHAPLSLDIHPELSPFTDLYFTIKRGSLELLDKNRQRSPDHGPVLSNEDIQSLETLLGAVMPKYRAIMQKNNFIPATTISLAPFLGLLGTVWGILVSFSHISMGHAGGATMMEGLATALGTTIVGLFVAIPSLIGFNYLRAHSSLLILEIEQTAYLLLNSIEVKYRQTNL
ncbi:motA/TolQ/ExbB proton channel family protein [Chlamydia ibidis]|uniref:MotA/TolQ/ExbB proton channel family protein n=2 Tax=Chlamydia ibidis TaxID=1405396 RepID=S7J4B8_9CHLA|nr:MotA/TolQ/ExbB proton channel family protein [Chlamydia ibidis]EPP34877.1 motA/TolQ/ExbB proton channel family protein [Chlamydia ibidis]EQM63131.1 motA/TolQ/ExbB proton channel family protein [Chlamydia ibidis 10-1398/6]